MGSIALQDLLLLLSVSAYQANINCAKQGRQSFLSYNETKLNIHYCSFHRTGKLPSKDFEGFAFFVFVTMKVPPTFSCHRPAPLLTLLASAGPSLSCVLPVVQFGWQRGAATCLVPF